MNTKRVLAIAIAASLAMLVQVVCSANAVA
jgi:hypothetical protein